MEREAIMQTVQELESETKVKAWVFEADKKFYHVALYSVFRAGNKVSIWESNKKGKRKTSKAIFTISGNDHLKCINEFLDSIQPREDVPVSEEIKIEE